MQLFETMRLENGDFSRLNYHIARMRKACKRLNIDFSQSEFENLIETIAKHNARGIFRVKVLINENGDFEHVIADLPIKSSFTARLVKLNVPDNHEEMIYKTTQRNHLAHNHATDIILLYNDEGKLLEFDIGNLMIKEQQQYFTPTYNEDFLKGCMRAVLIDEGKLIEKDYYIEEFKSKLQDGEIEVFLINSLREVADVTFYL